MPSPPFRVAHAPWATAVKEDEVTRYLDSGSQELPRTRLRSFSASSPRVYGLSAGSGQCQPHQNPNKNKVQPPSVSRKEPPWLLVPTGLRKTLILFMNRCAAFVRSWR